MVLLSTIDMVFISSITVNGLKHWSYRKCLFPVCSVKRMSFLLIDSCLLPTNKRQPMVSLQQKKYFPTCKLIQWPIMLLSHSFIILYATVCLPPFFPPAVYSSSMETANVSVREENIRLFKEVFLNVYTLFYDPTGGYQSSIERWPQICRKWLSDVNQNVFTSTELTHDLIRSLVWSLNDPYTSFLSKEEYEEVMPKHHASSGVGLLIADPIDGLDDLEIVCPIPQSPAEQAGILPLDHLIAIDDIQVSESHLTPGEAVALLRGPIGTKVHIKVRRISTTCCKEYPLHIKHDEHLETILHFMLKRTALHVGPGTWNIVSHPNQKDKIGYIRIHGFYKNTTEMCLNALKEMLREHVSFIILDVRNCLGGVFQEALAIASLFFEDSQTCLIDTIDSNGIWKHHRVGESRSIPNTFLQGLEQVPLGLVVNHASASCSEILAAALGDHSRATIIGEPTYGKGIIQHYFPLPQGNVLRQTIAEYISPVRHLHIHQRGWIPNSYCRASPQLKTVHQLLESDECIQASDILSC